MRACGLAAGACYVAQSFVTDAWQLLLLQALTGAAAGGILPALSALLARYTTPGEEGSVYGIDNSIGAAGRAVSPLVGTGVAAWFGLRSAFVATGVLFLVDCHIGVVAIAKIAGDQGGIGHGLRSKAVKFQESAFGDSASSLNPAQRIPIPISISIAIGFFDRD